MKEFFILVSQQLVYYIGLMWTNNSELKGHLMSSPTHRCVEAEQWMWQQSQEMNGQQKITPVFSHIVRQLINRGQSRTDAVANTRSLFGWNQEHVPRHCPSCPLKEKQCAQS